MVLETFNRLRREASHYNPNKSSLPMEYTVPNDADNAILAPRDGNCIQTFGRSLDFAPGGKRLQGDVQRNGVQILP
jgi:hypothetical protein